MPRRGARLCFPALLALLALLAAGATSCSGGASAPTAGPGRAASTAPRPRLVVLLVVDGLPSWSFVSKMKSARAGFARMMRDGVYYRAASYPYAATYTGPGHAALVTGTPPAVSGIVSNRWYDPVAGRAVDAVEDDGAPMLAVGPAAASTPSPPSKGASPKNLLVDSVGDSLIQATGGRAHVVALSVKRHAAVLLGGHRPTVAAWFDEGQSAFATSRYYAASTPAWLRQLAADHPAAPRIASYVWEHADPAWLAATTGLTDRAPGELGIFGHGPVFPHRPSAAERPGQAVQATPLSDQLLLEAALAALAGEHMGEDDVPDLLLVSFSAHDIIGHGWGQESWESLDEFARLDRIIGGLLDQLDNRVGRGRWALVFASDHGATHVIEQTVAAGGTARRVDPAAVGAAAQAAASRAIGPGEWIADTREQLLYLTAAAQALPAARRDRLLDAVVAAVRATPGVGVAVRTDAFAAVTDGATDGAAGCDRLSELDAVLCRSINHPRSGDVYYGPADGSVLMEKPWDTATHGSANAQDRRVPIIVIEPGAAPRAVDRPISSLQVAPTLARLLGIAAPPRALAPSL